MSIACFVVFLVYLMFFIYRVYLSANTYTSYIMYKLKPLYRSLSLQYSLKDVLCLGETKFLQKIFIVLCSVEKYAYLLPFNKAKLN